MTTAAAAAARCLPAVGCAPPAGPSAPGRTRRPRGPTAHRGRRRRCRRFLFPLTWRNRNGRGRRSPALPGGPGGREEEEEENRSGMKDVYPGYGRYLGAPPGLPRCCGAGSAAPLVKRCRGVGLLCGRRAESLPCLIGGTNGAMLPEGYPALPGHRRRAKPPRCCFRTDELTLVLSRWGKRARRKIAEKGARAWLGTFRLKIDPPQLVLGKARGLF